MTINIFGLIIWVICGVLTFAGAATSKDHKVPVFSYALCWEALIIMLVAQL